MQLLPITSRGLTHDDLQMWKEDIVLKELSS